MTCKLFHWWAFAPIYELYVCRRCGAICTKLEMALHGWKSPR